MKSIEYSISLPEIGGMILITITAILLGLLPMYVGMLNKLAVASVILGFLLVVIGLSLKKKQNQWWIPSVLFGMPQCLRM